MVAPDTEDMLALASVGCLCGAEKGAVTRLVKKCRESRRELALLREAAVLLVFLLPQRQPRAEVRVRIFDWINSHRRHLAYREKASGLAIP